MEKDKRAKEKHIRAAYSNKRMAKKKQSDMFSKTKRTILTVALCIVYTIFIFVGFDTFLPDVEYDSYCDRMPGKLVAENQTACLQQGGAWELYNTPSPSGENGYCDFFKECNEDYQDAQERNEQITFIGSLLISIIVIIITLNITIPSISSGLLAGAIFTSIIAVMRYWRYSGDAIRFLLIGIIFGLLIWIAYKYSEK